MITYIVREHEEYVMLLGREGYNFCYIETWIENIDEQWVLDGLTFIEERLERMTNAYKKENSGEQ